MMNASKAVPMKTSCMRVFKQAIGAFAALNTMDCPSSGKATAIPHAQVELVSVVEVGQVLSMLLVSPSSQRERTTLVASVMTIPV